MVPAVSCRETSCKAREGSNGVRRFSSSRGHLTEQEPSQRTRNNHKPVRKHPAFSPPLRSRFCRHRKDVPASICARRGPECTSISVEATRIERSARSLSDAGPHIWCRLLPVYLLLCVTQDSRRPRRGVQRHQATRLRELLRRQLPRLSRHRGRSNSTHSTTNSVAATRRLPSRQSAFIVPRSYECCPSRRAL